MLPKAPWQLPQGVFPRERPLRMHEDAHDPPLDIPANQPIGACAAWPNAVGCGCRAVGQLPGLAIERAANVQSGDHGVRKWMGERGLRSAVARLQTTALTPVLLQ